MSSTGTTQAGNEANNSSIGVTAWQRLNNANPYLYPYVTVNDPNATDTSVRLLVNGSVVGDNKAQGIDLGTGGDDIVTTYGGSADLWGQTPSASDINASNFGVVFSCTGTSISQYLELSQFGFSIPVGASIDGIEFTTTTDSNSSNVFMLDSTLNIYYTITSVATAPTVTTTATSLLKRTSVIFGGNVTDGGDAAVTDRGIYLGTTQGEQATKLAQGTGVGTYSIFQSGLDDDTLYYYKAYATNAAGTSYGDVLSFTTGNSLSVGDKTALPPFNRA